MLVPVIVSETPSAGSPAIPHRTQRRELAKAASGLIRRLTARQSRAIQNNDPREHRLAGFKSDCWPE